MFCALFHRFNYTLRTLDLSRNSISELELVLCQLQIAHVTEIDASRMRFDDADVICIAEALRCEVHVPVHRMTSAWRPILRASVSVDYIRLSQLPPRPT